MSILADEKVNRLLEQDDLEAAETLALELLNGFLETTDEDK